jgi:hypothetical protein
MIYERICSICDFGYHQQLASTNRRIVALGKNIIVALERTERVGINYSAMHVFNIPQAKAQQKR